LIIGPSSFRAVEVQVGSQEKASNSLGLSDFMCVEVQISDQRPGHFRPPHPVVASTIHIA